MIGSWKKEYCNSEPDVLQVIAPNLFIQRRNVHQITQEGMDGTSYTTWECESREIDFDTYNMLKSIEEMNTNAAIDEYTLQLIEEGVL